MKLLVINGPNLNMLGVREPVHYGTQTYDTLCELIRLKCRQHKIEVEIYQSNHEGCIVDKIHEAYRKFDRIIINPAAYTHTSIAISDALKCVSVPYVEVHISDISKREDYRKISYIEDGALKTISGRGINGYLEAVDFLNEEFNK